MYNEFVVPMMSRADWYALAGFVAVEYAAELTRKYIQPYHKSANTWVNIPYV